MIGHTVRPEGISSACGGAAWRVDVGLAATESDAGKPHIAASQVLEIVQGEGADTLKVRRPCFSCYPRCRLHCGTAGAGWQVLSKDEALMPHWSAQLAKTAAPG